MRTGGAVCASRLGELHAGCINRSLGGSFALGSIVVAQGGTLAATGVASGTKVEANGAVDVYPPNSNGDVAPEARLTKGTHGPFVALFDPSGDLWASNVNTGTLVEFTRAELATPNPAPAVTISASGDTLEDPYGMAFDHSGNLWVIGSYVGLIYEYARSQLARSGSPTPVTTISDFPGPPLEDIFDASGDLWVSTALSPSCPQGCVVEFSRAELATASPAPTVTISSTGGANMAFTPSGNLWMVTGGGPDRYGTPCNKAGGVHQGPALHIGFPHARRHDQLNRSRLALRVPLWPLRGRGRPLR
jgi:hypothetical protein